MNDKLKPTLRTSHDYVNIHELNERIRDTLKKEGLQYTGRGAVRFILRLQNLVNNNN